MNVNMFKNYEKVFIYVKKLMKRILLEHKNTICMLFKISKQFHLKTNKTNSLP